MDPAGTVRLGISVPDLRAFHAQLLDQGVKFTKEPTAEFGTLLAEFIDPDGASVSLSQAR